MVAQNPTWGVPRIHGELKMLAFDISERTVLPWMRKAPRDPNPAKRWKAFLNNHREVIAAMDFFTVPTFTFGVFCCFFVIAHDRLRILHCNVTKHLMSAWVIQQLREAFPYDTTPGFLSKFGLYPFLPLSQTSPGIAFSLPDGNLARDRSNVMKSRRSANEYWLGLSQ